MVMITVNFRTLLDLLCIKCALLIALVLAEFIPLII